jgi:hypothetical protein
VDLRDGRPQLVGVVSEPVAALGADLHRGFRRAPRPGTVGGMYIGIGGLILLILILILLF